MGVIRLPAWAELLRRNPVLRRLWLGAILSSLGDVLTWMALIWYVTERTGDGARVGTLLLSFALPAALTGGPIGRLLDRLQPRVVMVGDNVIRAALIALVPLLERLDLLAFPLLCVIAALSGALAPATRVGTSLVVVRLTDERQRADANAALALTEQAAVVVGPAIAGVLIGAWGAVDALWIDAASFLAMAWALLAIPNLPRQEKAEEVRGTWRDLAQPAIAAVTGLSLLFFFTYGPTEAALPLFVKRTLSSGATGMGYLWSAVGIGSLLGGTATGWLARRERTGWILAGIMALWGICEWRLGAARTLPVAVAWFLAGGLVWGPYVALKNTLMQKLVPEARLGAALGLQGALLTPSAPLGTALGGALLRFVAPESLIAASGLACIVGAGIALLVPALRRAA